MLLHQITLKNLLSFGPDSKPLELRPLNVLIGPNGSGKSNLIDAISLLRSAQSDISVPIRDGGGGREWYSKNADNSPAWLSVLAETTWFEVSKTSDHKVKITDQKHGMLRHKLCFELHSARLELSEELIQIAGSEPESVVAHIENHPLNGMTNRESGPNIRNIPVRQLQAGQSLVSQMRDPMLHSEITALGWTYTRFRIYRDWSFGRSAPLRQLQSASGSNLWLEEDCSNLALVLQRLGNDAAVRARLIENLQKFCESFSDFIVQPLSDFLQVLLIDGDFQTPAIRLSDGTLRYLCLLAILCDPKPPPLICIEEPELGLHPDLIPTIADLLKEASERTQLIVTTHSDTLVDCFNSSPEDIVVCEKIDGQTQMERLDKERLSVWLEEFSLGTLWSQGQIGGNRW